MYHQSLALRAFAPLMLCIAALPVWASAYRVGDVLVMDPQSRPTPPASGVGVVYLTVRNVGSKPDRLIGVSSPVAGSAGIHETVIQQNMAEMRAVPEVALPAGASVDIHPGGLHIMLFGLHHPLATGEEFPLTLVFAVAGPLVVVVRVVSPEP